MSKCETCNASKCQGTDTLIYVFIALLLIGQNINTTKLKDIASQLPQQTIYVTNTVVEYHTNQTAEAFAPAKN